MQLNLLKSKSHRAEVTDASLNHEGGLAIDAEFMNFVELRPYERILVGNLNNGERFETCAIAAVDERATAAWLPKMLVLGDASRRPVRQSGG